MRRYSCKVDDKIIGYIETNLTIRQLDKIVKKLIIKYDNQKNKLQSIIKELNMEENIKFYNFNDEFIFEV